MSFTRTPGSGRPRQTNRREDHHIVGKCARMANCFIAAIQAQVASSLEALCLLEPCEGAWLDESRFSLGSDDNRVRVWRLRRRLAVGHLGSWHPLSVLPLTPPFEVVPRTRKLDCTEMEPGRL
ncbi:HTH_Tnp_Tc3_2 domain-containing protein [Trichonephila clavipes]|uniref:HTH_Tnp_Tc3_2 domain-containing protein n=1 Tax=Trichonephila clavipes TaxID=2585209 RepID=A0A8X6RB03_TRICX|nr:HTH_Tnp_Tc3_2 domain-containing protein [Trichonephila clavipes]